MFKNLDLEFKCSPASNKFQSSISLSFTIKILSYSLEKRNRDWRRYETITLRIKTKDMKEDKSIYFFQICLGFCWFSLSPSRLRFSWCKAGSNPCSQTNKENPRGCVSELVPTCTKRIRARRWLYHNLSVSSNLKAEEREGSRTLGFVNGEIVFLNVRTLSKRRQP